MIELTRPCYRCGNPTAHTLVIERRSATTGDTGSRVVRFNREVPCCFKCRLAITTANPGLARKIARVRAERAARAQEQLW